MTKKRVILEMGAGNDLHGGNYTKAACRAVDDALHHSSLTMIRTLDVGAGDMYVDVTIDVAVIASAAIVVRLDLSDRG